MKKLYTLLSLIAISVSAFSQLVVVQTGFNNYVGTSVTAPAGWYMSWHSTSSPSYYTTATNYGIASPSYKFGLDSVFVITPQFVQADTVTFWCKGQSTSATSKLNLYASSDSISWTMFASRDTLPTTGTILKFGIPASAKWLMFVYRKISGNLAFDDVNILSYQNIYASFNASSITGCTPFCPAFTDQSISNNGSILSWNWNFGDGNTSTLMNPVHCYSATGTYTVSLIVANGGGDIDTAYSVITANPTPSAGFTSTINMNVVAFTDGSTGASSWYWDFGDASFSNVQNPVYAYAATGTYTVCLTVTNTNSCTSVFCQPITIATVGINDLNNLSSINVYPTVSSDGWFNIQYSMFTIQRLEVYNVVGEKVYSSQLPVVSGQLSNTTINGQLSTNIDLSEARSGIYFVKINTDAGTVTRKIVLSAE